MSKRGRLCVYLLLGLLTLGAADINECEDCPCSYFANCTNTNESFSCECNDGYSGDGFICLSNAYVFKILIAHKPHKDIFIDGIKCILMENYRDVEVEVINVKENKGAYIYEFTIDNIDDPIYIVAGFLRDRIVYGFFDAFEIIKLPIPVTPPLDKVCRDDVIPVNDIPSSYSPEVFDAEAECSISPVVIKFDACKIARAGIRPETLILGYPDIGSGHGRRGHGGKGGPGGKGPDLVCTPIFVMTDDGGLDVIFVHSFRASCGVEVEHADGIITYYFTVSSNVDPLSPPQSAFEFLSPIRRTRTFCTNLKCHFNDSQSISFSGALDANVQKVNFSNVEEVEQFQVDVNLCLNENCSLPLVGDSEVDVPDFVYFVGSLANADEDLIVEAESCYATPSPNPDDELRYNLIEMSCESSDNDVFVTIVTNGEENFFEFGFSSFMWNGEAGSAIFVHCEVVICFNVTGECSIPDCPAMRRRRSNRRDSEQFISFPQLAVGSSCEKTNPCQHYCGIKYGKPTCFCRPGFMLADDGMSCTKLVQPTREETWQSSEPRIDFLHATTLAAMGFSLMVLVLVIIVRIRDERRQTKNLII